VETAGGNMSEAARRLGISRQTLYYKMKKYGHGTA
jgi:transcriptional regulator of acetoin/glycerol metabolism